MTWQKERTAHETRLLAELASEGGAPNLDAMAYEDLEVFSSIKAERLIAAIWRTHEPTRELLLTAMRLRTYARMRSVAVQAREKGHIELALKVDAQCDEVYRTLPDIARW